MWKRQARDAVLRLHVGNLRVAAVTTRNTVAEGARRWNVAPSAPSSQLWAEYMAGTVMLTSFYKGEERIKMTLKAPTNDEVYVEAMAVGEVRGKASLHEGHDWRVFTKGYMQIDKILYGATKPYTTSVPAIGMAEADFQTFYDVSEQIPATVRIDHAIEADELRCCGLTIQTMPDSAPHDRYYDLSDLRFDAVPFSAVDVKDSQGMLKYLNALIPGADITEDKCRRVPLDFYCRCSKKSFGGQLARLGRSQLDDMIDDTNGVGLELTCHFCNEVHHFTTSELTSIRATCIE